MSKLNMRTIFKKKHITNIVSIAILSVCSFILLWCDSYILFNLAYIFTLVFIILRVLFSAATVNDKISYVIAFIEIMIIQIVFNTTIMFDLMSTGLSFTLSKCVGIVLFIAPFIIEKFFFYKFNDKYFIPTLSDWSSITYAQLLHDKEIIKKGIDKTKHARYALSKDNVTEIINDLPRHNSFSYINNGVLTDAYFEKAKSTIKDAFIYIVLTKSGSPASNVIGVFTNNVYNHVSLSFDKELHTIVSYNGGEKITPPGLNHEILEQFNKNVGSAVLVYRLKISEMQKQKILNIVRKINNEGSSYNLLGLTFKYSHKPNIMFCSQFVYTILDKVGATYFEKKATNVKPTDFIELDYYRKIEFTYEIKFNSANSYYEEI